MTKNQKNLLEFARRHPGWQSLGGSGHPNSIEKKAAVALEKAGYLELARHSGDYGRDWQFRLRSENPKKRSTAHLRKYQFKKGAVRRTGKKAARKSAPARTAFAIYAQGSGKKMHFDGSNRFTENAIPKLFASQSEAVAKAKMLLKHFPKLRRYRVTVESF